MLSTRFFRNFSFFYKQKQTRWWIGILSGLSLSLIPCGVYQAQGVGEQPNLRRAPSSPYSTPNCGCGDNETCEGSWSSDSSNAVMRYYCVNKPGVTPATSPEPNNSTNRSNGDCKARANAELEFLRGLLTFLSDENIKARAVQSDLQNTIKRLTKLQKQALSQYDASNAEFEITQQELDNLREFIGQAEDWVDSGFTVNKIAQAALAIRKVIVPTNPNIKLSASTQALIKKIDAKDKSLDATVSVLQNYAEDKLESDNLGWERLITLARDYYDYIYSGTSQEIADSKLRASEVFTNFSKRTGDGLQKYRTISKENQKTINGLSQSIKLVEARLKKSEFSCK